MIMVIAKLMVLVTSCAIDFFIYVYAVAVTKILYNYISKLSRRAILIMIESCVFGNRWSSPS